MPEFSKKSKEELKTCHPILQDIFNEAILHYDHTILEGRRSDERQEKLFKEGKTKKRAGESKHNKTISEAADASPYPIPDRWGIADKKEYARFHLFAGIVIGIAITYYGDVLRWGGDWDGDGQTNDQTFDDLVHFELKSFN